METKLRITGNWDELKAKLKQKHPSLTDADLKYSQGKEDELSMRISERLDKTQEEVSDIIDEIQSKRQGTESERTDRNRNDRERSDRDESENDRTERDRMDSDREEISSKQKESKKEQTKKY